MDYNEVYVLLGIVEKLAGHGTSFSHIRKATVDRLNEIDVELGPAPVEPIDTAEEDQGEPVNAA